MGLKEYSFSVADGQQRDHKSTLSPWPLPSPPARRPLHGYPARRRQERGTGSRQIVDGGRATTRFLAETRNDTRCVGLSFSAVEGFQDRGEGFDAGEGDGIERDDQVLDAGIGEAAYLSGQLLRRAGEGPGRHHPLPWPRRLPGIIEQIDLDADDAGQRCGVATNVVTRLVDPGIERLHTSDIVLAVDIPAVGIASGEAEHAPAAGA